MDHGGYLSRKRAGHSLFKTKGIHKEKLSSQIRMKLTRDTGQREGAKEGRLTW